MITPFFFLVIFHRPLVRTAKFMTRAYSRLTTQDTHTLAIRTSPPSVQGPMAVCYCVPRRVSLVIQREYATVGTEGHRFANIIIFFFFKKMFPEKNSRDFDDLIIPLYGVYVDDEILPTLSSESNFRLEHPNLFKRIVCNAITWALFGE